MLVQHLRTVGSTRVLLVQHWYDDTLVVANKVHSNDKED